MLLMFNSFFIFAFIANTPREIFDGLIRILNSPDVLISDYIVIGTMGSALVNSAVIGIASVLLMKFFKCENTGTNIMSIWLMAGFAFFGKNLINCIPIVLGGFLYSLLHRKPFSEILGTTLLATSLAPAVSQMFFVVSSSWSGILLGLFLGIALGYIMIPVSRHIQAIHGGFNLYNAGFAGGIVSLLLTAALRNAGFVLDTVSFWSENNNIFLALFLMFICLAMLLMGVWLSGHGLHHLVELYAYKEYDNIIYDAYTKHGERAYMNMGMLGACSTLMVLILDGELSGPLVGGIFTIIGFGCLGKNLLNISPPIFGCMLAVFLNGWELNKPEYLLTMLFSATLAPISSKFGKAWGIMAGFLHLNLTVKLAETHAGLSLYNNGFAGGFVVMVLVPLISSFYDIRKRH